MQDIKMYSFYSLSSEENPEDIRYIGVTSRTLEERFRLHKYCATHEEKRGLPVHKWMYSIYNKGGKILCKKIYECEEKDWEQTEINLIDKYKKEGYRLLNLDKGGKGVITEEKRSKSSIERSAEAHRKPIIAYNLDGTIFKEYPSITQATIELGIKDINNIINVLRGRSKSASGYLWRYKSDYANSIDEYSIERHSKTIYSFSIDGNLVNKYDALIDAINDINGSYNGLNGAIANKTLYHGYFWSYDKESDITQFSNPNKYYVIYNGELHFFKFYKEIVSFVGCSKSFLDTHFKKSNEFMYKEYKIGKLN